ncbi:MAG: EAL domain-containing protein, partial [Burkholderiales bacterium]|nr:EAL domain-containing protein [Burkholderiales bacterium]
IVRATIDLAHNLDLEVIGEGTATEQTFAELAKLGCEAAQGEFISRPISAQDFARWAKESPWRPRLSSAASESHDESIEDTQSTDVETVPSTADNIPLINEDPPELPDTVPVITETIPPTADETPPIRKLDAARTDKRSIESTIKELEEFIGQMDLQDDLSSPTKRRNRKRAGRR